MRSGETIPRGIADNASHVERSSRQKQIHARVATIVCNAESIIKGYSFVGRNDR